MLSEDFKEGYRDGYAQAVVNIDAVLREYVKTHHSVVIDFVEIREKLKKYEVDKVDEDYLNQ
jgi:hypothetical protein